jgi:hypothetical protein
MRYTEERNPDVRTVPAGEIWVGIIPAARPYIAIASRLNGDESPVVCHRFGSVEAQGMAAELVRPAAELEAPNN